MQRDFLRLQNALLVQRYSGHTWKIHDLVAFICRSELDSQATEETHVALGDHFLKRAPRTTRGGVWALDSWIERACREYLKTSSRLREGKNLLSELSAPAKAEGRYDMFLELSLELVGKQSGQDLWIEYHHAHCAALVGADRYALTIAEQLCLRRTTPQEHLLTLAATRLCSEIIHAAGDSTTAHRRLELALKGFEAKSRKDAPALNQARGVLAGLLTSLGRIADAIQILDRLILDAQQRGDDRGGAVNITRKALALMDRRELDDASTLLDAAHAVFMSRGDRRGSAWVDTNRAEIALLKHDDKRALAHLRDAEAIHVEINLAALDHRTQLSRCADLSRDSEIRTVIDREIRRIDQARQAAAKRFRMPPDSI
jgi:tetratricopeptide (TPR) repeat protein